MALSFSGFWIDWSFLELNNTYRPFARLQIDLRVVLKISENNASTLLSLTFLFVQFLSSPSKSLSTQFHHPQIPMVTFKVPLRSDHRGHWTLVRDYATFQTSVSNEWVSNKVSLSKFDHNGFSTQTGVWGIELALEICSLDAVQFSKRAMGLPSSPCLLLPTARLFDSLKRSRSLKSSIQPCASILWRLFINELATFFVDMFSAHEHSSLSVNMGAYVQLILTTWGRKRGGAISQTYQLPSAFEMLLYSHANVFVNQQRARKRLKIPVSYRLGMQIELRVRSIANGWTAVMNAGNWAPGTVVFNHICFITKSWPFSRS